MSGHVHAPAALTLCDSPRYFVVRMLSVGPRNSLDVVIKRKIPAPGRNRYRYRPIAWCRCLKHADRQFILYGPRTDRTFSCGIFMAGTVSKNFLFKIFFVTRLKAQKVLSSLDGNVQLTSAERERERSNILI